jgi:hypothetical protein
MLLLLWRIAASNTCRSHHADLVLIRVHSVVSSEVRLWVFRKKVVLITRRNYLYWSSMTNLPCLISRRYFLGLFILSQSLSHIELLVILLFCLIEILGCLVLNMHIIFLIGLDLLKILLRTSTRITS